MPTVLRIIAMFSLLVCKSPVHQAVTYSLTHKMEAHSPHSFDLGNNFIIDERV